MAVLAGAMLLVCCTWFAQAQMPPAQTTLPGYEKRLFQITDGLPEGTVQSFAQTPDRFLWIGTTGGLVRFDGSNFLVFDRDNTPEFRENSVFCMLTALDGSLWIGMEGSGLLHLSHGHFTTYRAEQGLTDPFVRALAQDHNGTLWIGTNNGLFRLAHPEYSAAAPSSIQRVDGPDGLPVLAVNAIREDSSGRLWLGGSQLWTLHDGHSELYPLSGEASRNRVKSITETSDKSIWVGTVSGLHRLRPGETVFERLPHISGTVRALRQTDDGRLWISIVGQGGTAYRLNAHNLEDPLPIPTDAVLSIFQDVERNVWVGTQAGMIRFSKTPVGLIPLPDARDSDFGTVFLDRSGDLWAASTHLFRVRQGVPQRFNFPGLENVRVRIVFQDRADTFWIGTEGSGLYHVGPGGLQHFDVHDGLANNFIRAILQAADGSLWIGTDEGVSHLQDGHFRSFRMKEGLAYISVRSMLEDRNHDLWIGTELGLSHLHGGQFVNDIPVQALQREKIWAIHQDASGSLWLGTRNNGLFRYRDGRIAHISTAEGLPTRSIYQILEDKAGHLWVSGFASVSLLNRQELDDIAEGKRSRLRAIPYSFANANETVQLYGGMQSAGCASPSGEVWFPSNRGIVHIQPQERQPAYRPPMILTAATADGRAISVDRAITLSPGNLSMEIAYSPVQLRSQDGLRFRYRLEGVDKNWIDAGVRRVAYYTSLPPGRFRFAVQTFSISDPSSLSETAIAIVQQPHFYRTWWFIAFCTALVLGLIFGLYRYRIAQVRRQFAAVLEERSRLAREMHDTLLQGCTSVSVVLEGASSVDNAQDDGLKQYLIDCARTQIRTTINEARDAVWRLRQSSAHGEDLGRLLRTMAQRVAEESGVPVESQLGSDLSAIPEDTAREVMMIAREAVHNAVRHGSPERVTVRVQTAVDGLSVVIADDGCGFESSAVGSDPSRHFGLVGMRERAAHIGGTLTVQSAPNQGCRVTLLLPNKAMASHAS